MDREANIIQGLGDLRLIRYRREFSRALEFGVSNGRPTEKIARRLGYVEREMERRGIRHDDWRGEVLDSHGVRHLP